MKFNFAYITALFGLLVFFGCSDLKEDLTAPPEVNVHEEGVTDTNSVGFHGNSFATQSFHDCAQCHAADFSGGTAKVSCAAADCHPTLTNHFEDGFLNPLSQNSHGSLFVTETFMDCALCHGDNYFGGSSNVSCATQGCHPTLTDHIDGFIDVTSPNFHGKLFVSQTFSDCALCHADNFSGGPSNSSCTNQGCHPTLGAHKDGFVDAASPNFHGLLFPANSFSNCALCHADDYSGGTSNVSCATSGCHPILTTHKDGFLDVASPNFHGNLFPANSFSDCVQCHGDDYLGGNSNVGCADAGCHPSLAAHKDGFLNPASPEFHGKFLASINWDLPNCIQCHAEDYSGGVAQFSCNTCHTQPAGPEACNTCHGDFSNPSMIAPPQDLAGNTSTSASGVGAHQKHLFNVQIAQNVPCTECHTVPPAFDSQGHIDGTPGAELVFGAFTTTQLGDPTYNRGNFTCSNTYCHGNFEFKKSDAPGPSQFAYTGDVMRGRNYSPIWNVVDGSQAACGTCHGQVDAQNNITSIVPEGHIPFPLDACATCHSGIVDAQGNIIDAQKHINGDRNVFGN